MPCVPHPPPAKTEQDMEKDGAYAQLIDEVDGEDERHTPKSILTFAVVFVGAFVCCLGIAYVAAVAYTHFTSPLKEYELKSWVLGDPVFDAHRLAVAYTESVHRLSVPPPMSEAEMVRDLQHQFQRSVLSGDAGARLEASVRIPVAKWHPELVERAVNSFLRSVEPDWRVSRFGARSIELVTS